MRESRDRVRAALLSSGLTWPLSRITVNLAPSGVRKSGAGLDLAIAMGVLAASGAVGAAALGGLAFLGELGLDGSIRRVPGIVPLVAALGEQIAVVPAGCGAEAAWSRAPRSAPSSALRNSWASSPAARSGRHRGHHRPLSRTSLRPTWLTCGGT